MHIKKGDNVLVLSGKDKGRRGKVLQSFPKKHTVVVEGINAVKKHTKPTREMRQGGIIEKAQPMVASKLMLICPRCNKPTKIKREREENKRVRRCKKCGETI